MLKRRFIGRGMHLEFRHPDLQVRFSCLYSDFRIGRAAGFELVKLFIQFADLFSSLLAVMHLVSSQGTIPLQGIDLRLQPPHDLGDEFLEGFHECTSACN